MATQHDASPNKNTATSKQIPFDDVGGVVSCSPLPPCVYTPRIASQTKMALIRKEQSTPLLNSPVCVPGTTENDVSYEQALMARIVLVIVK